MTKKELMIDLIFCQLYELMNGLFTYAKENYTDDDYYNNHTSIQNDIIRLRRELNEVRKKLDK